MILRYGFKVPLVSDWVQRYRVRQILAGSSAVKLHLGCGTDYQEGYVNIDVDPRVNPDLVMKAEALESFPPNSVDIIESYHLFEHFHLMQARQALRRWFQVLKPGGLLILELPNIAVCTETIGQYFDDAGIDLAVGGIYGYPPAIEKEGNRQLHKWGWTPESVIKELTSVGFEDCREYSIKQTWRPAAQFRRDMQIRAAKPQH